MNAEKNWTLVGLSLILAVLVFFEGYCENQVSDLTTSLSVKESLVGQAKQQNATLRQLLQTIANRSQQDSALANLLTKRGIHVSFPPQATNGASSAPPAVEGTGP